MACRWRCQIVGRAVSSEPAATARCQGVTAKALGYIVVATGAVAFTLPFIWMVSTSLKSEQQLIQETFVSLLPNPVVWENYADAWFGRIPFPRYFLNSLIITVVPVAANVLVSSLVASPLPD